MADILKTYFKDIKGNRGLDKQSTQALAIQAKTGDTQAINDLVKNHLLLVAKIAGSYSNKGVEMVDLIAEGNLGLLKAIEKWNPGKGASFTTCASWWIKQSIIRNCMHSNRIVRVPEHVSELMRTGRTEFKYGEVNIDQPNSEGDTLADCLPDKEENIFIDEETMNTKNRVKKFVSYLKPKEREVIELYFGLTGEDEKDVREIAEQLSLTTTRINQLLRSSMKKMQEIKNEI
jgi:RNA polymerase sigma factor (sigma-70 family)